MNNPETVALVRSQVAVFDLSESHGVLSIKGNDRVPFLQSITCNDVEKLLPGSGQHNAILNPKSYILAEFWIYALDQEFLLITEKAQIDPIISLFEQYHFSEDVHFEDKSSSHALLAIQGPLAYACLKNRLEDNTPIETMRNGSISRTLLAKTNVHIISKSYTGDNGYIIFHQREHKENIIKELTAPDKNNPAVECDNDIFDILRTESGVPVYGKDMDDTTMLLEIGLDEEIVSLTKGCFPGQETVARTANRGQVQKRLVGLHIDEKISIPSGETIHYKEKASGQIKSGVWSPTLNASIYFAYLHRRLQPDDKEIELNIGDQTVKTKVCHLPFYVPAGVKEKAHEEYHIGMNQYHKNNYETAQQHFEKAIEINPYDSDAHEALSVVLEHMGHLDDAIRLNKKFAKLDPNAVMAHSNLSRLYMLKGWKEKAEEEQSKATALGWIVASKGIKAKEVEETQKKAKKAEQERRLNIFKQVIEMDAEDEVANFGIGKLYLELHEYKKSIAALQTVIKNNDQYSAAYALLGTALIKDNQKEEAKIILRKGIEVASNQGDLMPKNAMEQELNELT